MKLISTKDYELITINPKMANPSITSAGIKVIMNSFDITFLSPTSIFSYSSKNMYCKLFLELIVGMVGNPHHTIL